MSLSWGGIEKNLINFSDESSNLPILFSLFFAYFYEKKTIFEVADLQDILCWWFFRHMVRTETEGDNPK